MDATYINFLNQKAEVGLEWYGYRWEGTSFEDGRTYNYSENPPWNQYWDVFFKIGTPINILDYFLEKYGSLTNFPKQTTYEYWDADGNSLPDSINATWYAGYDYNSTTHKAFFYGGLLSGVTAKTALYNTNYGKTNYSGVDLTQNTITEEDRAMTDLYFFKPVDLSGVGGNNYLPVSIDSTCTTTPSSGQIYYDYMWGTGYRVFTGIMWQLEYIEGGVAAQKCSFRQVTGYNKIGVIDNVLIGRSYVHSEPAGFPDPFLLPGFKHLSYLFYNTLNVIHGDFMYTNVPSAWEETPEPDEPEDYDDMHTNVGQGGGGSNAYSTDSLPEPTWPSIGACESGFAHLYAPWSQQLFDLSSYLWSDDWLTNLTKIIASDPIDAIINLMHVPFSLAKWRSSESPCVCGNVDTHINMPILPNSYLPLDLGVIPLTEKLGNSTDYAPNTTAQLYLPFIGIVELDTNEILTPRNWANGTSNLHIYYCMNSLTGEAICRVYIERPTPNRNLSGSTNQTLRILIGQYTCNMGFNIALNGANYSSFYKNLVNTGVSMIGGAVSGGMTGAALTGLSGAVDTAMSGHTFTKSGSTSGGSAPMNLYTPFLEIMQPSVAVDMDDYRKLNGWPTSIGRRVGSMSGYTEFESIEISGFKGTDEEAAELRELCKSGIII